MGVSRTCAHRWISRYRAHGLDGLQDRSSRPKSYPHSHPGGSRWRCPDPAGGAPRGADGAVLCCGTSARTVSRILARAGHATPGGLGPGDRGAI
ncbi:helix-turn-helix domain-containing protein [Arthrobacter sp. Z1-9]